MSSSGLLNDDDERRNKKGILISMKTLVVSCLTILFQCHLGFKMRTQFSTLCIKDQFNLLVLISNQ